VSKRPRIRTLCLVVLLLLVTIGCGREGRLPTAVTPPNDLTSATPNLDTRDGRMLETVRDRGHRHLPPRVVIAEAKEGLGAVLTGEQVYFQKWAAFTDVADTADFRVTLGVYLGDLLQRWDFSVSGASVTGFVATARGRPYTEAEGIVMTLRYVRGQPVSWAVEGTHHDRGFGDPRDAIIAEAKGALGAVLTGEQSYYQRWGTFTDVADTADFRVTLGVYLDEPSRQWAFSVSGASVTGFLAKAQGRDHTDAEGITVTLSYQRGQPVVWTVQPRRPRH
jgi:hypothetical protein